MWNRTLDGMTPEAIPSMMPSSPSPNAFPPLPTHCPVTGLPVHGHSSWRYRSPDGSYRLRVSVIGERIVWLQPQGYARLAYARQGMALLADVLFAMMPSGAPFIAMDDYSNLAGASLDARRYVIKKLRRARRIEAYIVYGPSHAFHLGFRLGRQLGIFPFETVIARDYAEAAGAARDRLPRMETRLEGRVQRKEVSPCKDGCTAEAPARGTSLSLAGYADELLECVGGIYFETYGVSPTFRKVALEHPFRPVYDALAILRDDMQAILRRHHEARQGLEQRQKELTEKQAMLNETHTTLKILLEARRKSRERYEHRIKDRFQSLLQPLVDGLESVAGAAGGHPLLPLLNHVIRHIAAPLPCEAGESMPIPFTSRERLIACLYITGHDTQAIAGILKLSRRTIENHCQRMRIKAGLKGRRPTLQTWLRRHSGMPTAGESQ